MKMMTRGQTKMNEQVDLTPAVVDLFLYAGDDEIFQVSFVDENNTAIDVSLFTWTSQIRQTRNSTDSVDISIDTTEASTGILTLTVSGTVTRDLPRVSYWDLQYVPSDSENPSTILQGTVNCKLDVTR